MADPTVTPLFGVPIAPQNAAPVNSPSGTVIPAGSATPTPAPRETEYVERDGKHRGVAGVARDILGFLGDFLLTRLRMPAMYGPAQQQRKLEAAMEGFDQDPLSAIARVTDVDYAAGSRLRDQFIDNQRQAATQASTAEAREARIQIANTAAADRTRSRVGAMLGTMGTWDDTRRQTNYPQMRQQALNYAKANGLDLSTELPETFDSVALDAFIDGAVPVGTQRAQRLTAERNEILADQGQQRIDETVTGRQERTVTTRRGQDIRSSDTRRGQDIRSGDTRRGQDIRRDTPRGGRRAPPSVPQEGERRTIGGRTFVWRNGRAVAE